MGDDPLVSIAMPVYNPDHTFRAAVLSIIKQDLESWELLIVDDGSRNDISEFIGDLLEPRITIIKDGVNLGLAKRLNQCIDHAKGVYFARMDQDDISYPSRLSKQVKFLERRTDIDLLATKALAIDENDQPLGTLPYALTHDELTSKSWRGIQMPHPTWMGRLRWFKSNKYRIPASFLSEDQELLLRVSESSRYATIDEILFAYRIRGSVNRSKLRSTRLAIAKFQIKHFLCCRQYSNAMKSAFAYPIKTAIDTFSSRSGGLGRFGYSQPTTTELEQWQFCRSNLFGSM
jgi:glycosyltransferase involved in cell wall biosynthesis